MRRPRSAVKEREGVRVCREFFEGTLEWIFRDLGTTDDFGVDAFVEVVVGTTTDDQLVSGRLLALQIKDGASHFDGKETESGWRFNSDQDHLAYWLGHSLPVVIVLVHPDGSAYWEHVGTDTVQEFDKGFRVDVPSANLLSEASRDALVAFAGTNQGLVEGLPRRYAELPPDTVANLRRAEAVDPLGAARTAERLATGREQPDFVVSTLLEAQPVWLNGSDAAQDLWMAVASYATEHELAALYSAEAFGFAAGAPGDRGARAHAFAGASLLFTDNKELAREHFELGREAGQVLLADFGLAVLEVPPNTAPSVDVPVSIATASTEELDREPTVLNFLAENAKRQGKANEGIELRRRVANRSSDAGSGIHLELAKELVARAIREGVAAGKDVREAMQLAQAAVVDRRRWSGPSGKAVAVAVRILLLTGEYRQAVAESTSSSLGGRATPLEASDPDVIRFGALAALACGDDAAWDRYLELLGDDQEQLHRHLTAQRADFDAPSELPTEQARRDELIALWVQLAAESTDDELTAVCVSRLAHLGVWSERADDMIARHVLPDREVETLRAVCQVHTNRDEGLRQLRRLADSSPNAAMELVFMLEADPDEALNEVQRQLAKWHSWDLALQQLSLLLRLQRFAEAEALALRCIDDASFSIGTRQRFGRWLSNRCSGEKRFADAANAAYAALGLSDDEDDLAWQYIGSLFNAGDTVRSRNALGRFSPQPITDSETDLWVRLHLGVDLSSTDAGILLSIIDRLPPGRRRDAFRGLLLREVLTPSPTSQPFPAEIQDAARRLAEEAGLDPGNIGVAEDDAAQWQRPDPANYQALLTKAREGRVPLAELAIQSERPYTAALIDPPFGAIVAADAGENLRKHGRDTATQALGAAGWVVDLSVLANLTLLDQDAADRLRSSVLQLTITSGSVDDVVRARDEYRGTAASYTLMSTADGPPRRIRIDPHRLALMRERAEAMEQLCSQVSIATGRRGQYDTLAETIALAAFRQEPLWCDDNAARQQARRKGISTFSTVNLIDALDLPDAAMLFRKFACHSVIDLPLSAADITSVAALTGWLVGPAHAALASRGCWQNWSDNWLTQWRMTCEIAIQKDLPTLIAFTKSALTGALANVSTERTMSRYREIVVIGLAACHVAGVAPGAYLDQVAMLANPTIVPTPRSMHPSLTAELRDLGAATAPIDAAHLLGIDLPP
jgi:hypothetical protein